jgi:hypothetical protein
MGQMHRTHPTNPRIGRSSRSSPGKPGEIGRSNFLQGRGLLRLEKPGNPGVLRLLRPTRALIGLGEAKRWFERGDHHGRLAQAGAGGAPV